jgi:ABC-2 type transport system permease protein
MTAITHSWFMMLRYLRALIRQPWYIAFTLLQPIIWLLLYGQLFQKVVELHGFHAISYIDFLTPGVVIMTALFSSGWTGMGLIREIDRGTLDRFLVSPLNRSALIAGRLCQVAFITVVQSAILLVLGLLLGARYAGGIGGIAVLVVCAILVAVPIGALSSALALAVRKEESVIGASNFILLPLTFLSPVFMASALMPGWMRIVARFNPVNWSVEAARGALQAQTDWNFVLSRCGFLIALAIASMWIAIRAFRSYQRSV